MVVKGRAQTFKTPRRNLSMGRDYADQRSDQKQRECSMNMGELVRNRGQSFKLGQKNPLFEYSQFTPRINQNRKVAK